MAVSFGTEWGLGGGGDRCLMLVLPDLLEWLEFAVA